MSDPQPGSPLPPPPPGYPGQQPSGIPPPPPGAVPPPQSAYQPPPGAPPSAFAPPPAGYPQQGPMSPMGALGIAGFSMAQFRGVAGTSVLIGLIGIAVPVLTTLFFSGGGVFFYVLPIFGLIAGVRAVTRGLVIGGAVGIVLNVIAGFMSLLMSGVFFGGGG